MSSRGPIIPLVLASVALVVAGPVQAQRTRAVRVRPFSLDCDPAKLSAPLSDQCRERRLAEGQRLFDSETFGGNGRTCLTCHSKETGTFSPADAQARLAANPDDPLFRHDGLDDGLRGISRIIERATVRVTLPLPPYLKLVDDPTATHVTFNRGTPTTMNTPALDTRLMSDLRDATLQSQASGAIHGHAQNVVEPTRLQLDLIAEFEKTDPRFFSDARMMDFAASGIVPALPLGTTASEQRGRRFFVDTRPRGNSMDGACAFCHSGPMLNETNRFASLALSPPVPQHVGIGSAGVSERNRIGNPVYKFEIHDEFGFAIISTPDIGVLMSDPATPTLALEMQTMGAGYPLRQFANMFKTPTLWGVKNTAPYFHDNSAKDLDEVLEHYNWFFENIIGLPKNSLTPQDIIDIKAFLNLL